jgi:hypothetical protein
MHPCKNLALKRFQIMLLFLHFNTYRANERAPLERKDQTTQANDEKVRSSKKKLIRDHCRLVRHEQDLRQTQTHSG